MKKSVLILIMLAGCLLLGSCAVSADQMLEDFNGQIYEDKGGGLYEKLDGISINTRIIPNNVYNVFEHNSFTLKISDEYLEYKWSIKDNKTSKEYDIPNGYYRLTVNSYLVDFLLGREYTLTVVVKDIRGKSYTDSATIKVRAKN